MVYKDSAGKEIHEGDSLMDLTPGFVGEISEVFLDEDEGELAVNQDGTTIYLYEMNTEVDSLIVNEETMNIEKEEGDGEEECAVIDTTIGVEPEIPVLCSYLGVLETARREALADERYEDVQRLIETIRYNTGTLEQLRREYSMMRKDSQSTR